MFLLEYFLFYDHHKRHVFVEMRNSLRHGACRRHVRGSVLKCSSILSGNKDIIGETEGKGLEKQVEMMGNVINSV